jgi:hypothetical protein
VNNVGSYAMIVTFYRCSCRSIKLISWPSMSIYPECSSTILAKARLIVDLPAPVRPTMPTLCPGSTSNDKLCRTISVLGLYLS